MSGRYFVAVVRLSNKANETLALPGETCERVPESSLSWLEQSGRIRRAETVSAEAPAETHGGRRKRG